MPFPDPAECGRIGGRAGARTRSSPEWHLKKIRDLVDASRRQQGLPEHIVDALTLAKVASLLRQTGEGGGSNAA
jgi:hypothetical protein